MPEPFAWRAGRVVERWPVSPRAVTLRLEVEAWPGHVAGQRVDVRLTAEDGYQATRQYSISSAPSTGTLELTVERIDDGEVSPYLVDVALPRRRARDPRADRRLVHVAGRRSRPAGARRRRLWARAAHGDGAGGRRHRARRRSPPRLDPYARRPALRRRAGVARGAAPPRPAAHRDQGTAARGVGRLAGDDSTSAWSPTSSRATRFRPRSSVARRRSSSAPATCSCRPVCRPEPCGRSGSGPPPEPRPTERAG